MVTDRLKIILKEKDLHYKCRIVSFDDFNPLEILGHICNHEYSYIAIKNTQTLLCGKSVLNK